MTAETSDETVVYNEQRIYMPFPGRLGRGKEMGRGPYEKSGILRETSLAPLKTTQETFEISNPYEDVEKDGKTRRELLNDELNVTVTLYYVPFGEFDGNEVIFFEDEQTIDLKAEWIWR